MEDKINMKFNFSGIEELREAEKIYRNCFKIKVGMLPNIHL